MIEDRPNGNYLRGFKQRIAQLLVARHRADYDIGRMIEECRAGRYWRWWTWTDKEGNDRVGYPSFSDWTWAVLGFKRRKADMLRENFNNLSPMDLDEQGPTFSRAMRIGWSKLHQVLRVARDESTLLSWLAVVEEEKLSFEEVKAKVGWALAESAESAGSESEGSSVVGGDPDTTDDPAPPTRVHWPVVFESRTALDVVLKAHKAIQSRYDEEIGLGKAMAMLATFYLSKSARDYEGGAPVDAEYMVQAFEEQFGLIVNPGRQVASAAPTPRRRRRPPVTRDL
jgi:hypothetical protein